MFAKHLYGSAVVIYMALCLNVNEGKGFFKKIKLIFDLLNSLIFFTRVSMREIGIWHKFAYSREKSLGTSHYFSKMVDNLHIMSYTYMHTAPFSYLHRYVLYLTL